MEELRILLPRDSDAIRNLENKLAGVTDPLTLEMLSWGAWRLESLDHYLPKGWSFGIFSQTGEMRGYALAQPLLFFRGLTQVLWVERVIGESVEIRQRLVENMIAWGRDKHLQSVIFNPHDEYVGEILTKIGKYPLLQNSFFEVNTTRRR